MHEAVADRAATQGRADGSASWKLTYLRDVTLRRKATTAREYERLWKKHVVPQLGLRVDDPLDACGNSAGTDQPLENTRIKGVTQEKRKSRTCGTSVLTNVSKGSAAYVMRGAHEVRVPT